jgi:hypothetical protein
MNLALRLGISINCRSTRRPQYEKEAANMFYLLKNKLVPIFKNPVRTSKRTPHFTVTKINWLTLFKEIIAV